ncbi:hypothetical protein niasHT_019333 [Heterodera trifolii]|uniref:Fido domain-containing protein n=1 Tax=Heterodera trifolii TaxID=157864 RepID=A0ABD2L6E6_9BILA
MIFKRILALHHAILVIEKYRAAAAGVYRLTDVYVGDDPIGLLAWEISAAMTDFCRWLKEAEEELHGGEELASFVATAHLRLVQIHPVEDWNGCLGRLLMNVLLKRSGKGPIILRESSFHDQYDECMKTRNLEPFIAEINVESEQLGEPRLQQRGLIEVLNMDVAFDMDVGFETWTFDMDMAFDDDDSDFSSTFVFQRNNIKC